MNTRIALLIAAAVAFIAGCASREQAAPQPTPDTSSPLPPGSAVVVPAMSLDEYKLALAQHISQRSASRVFSERPQALLRSVVVVRYVIDAHGHLVSSEIMRSNRDRVTEAAALQALRTAAPFPPPSSNLLNRGHVELAETWLFNKDGRFQLRTVALPQMDR